MTNQWLWLIGSGAMVFIVPFTIFVLMPLNNRLLAATDTDPNLTEMLKQWAPMQLVRTTLAVATFVLFLALAVEN